MKIRYIIYLFLGVFAMSSCEDVIQLELKNTDPRIVIDAVVDASKKDVKVVLTETNDFYNNNEPTQLIDAKVELIDAAQNVINIPINDDGYYYLENYEVVVGEEYTMEITVSDTKYTAKTIAPRLVELVGVDTLYSPPFGGGSGPGFYQTLMGWVDQEGEENYYRLRAFKDDSLQVGPYAFYNDRGLDGEIFVRPLMERVSIGEKVEFQLYSVDEETHDYFVQVASLESQGLSSSVPFNPRGNFDNNALGYFGVIQKSSITIQF